MAQEAGGKALRRAQPDAADAGRREARDRGVARPRGGLHFCRDFVVIWQDICREAGGSRVPPHPEMGADVGF